MYEYERAGEADFSNEWPGFAHRLVMTPRQRELQEWPTGIFYTRFLRTSPTLRNVFQGERYLAAGFSLKVANSAERSLSVLALSFEKLAWTMNSDYVRESHHVVTASMHLYSNRS